MTGLDELKNINVFYKILKHRSWRRTWQPTPVFLPGKSHGQRSLVGYSPWGLQKESDTTTQQQYHLHRYWKAFDKLHCPSATQKSWQSKNRKEFFFSSSFSSANSMMLLKTKMSMTSGVKFTKSFLPKPSEVRFLSLLYPRKASFNGSL